MDTHTHVHGYGCPKSWVTVPKALGKDAPRSWAKMPKALGNCGQSEMLLFLCGPLGVRVFNRLV